MLLHKKSIVVLLSPLWDSVVSRIIIHLHQICRRASCLYAGCGEMSWTEVRYSVCLGAAFGWILFILVLCILFCVCGGEIPTSYYGISQRLLIWKTNFFFLFFFKSVDFLPHHSSYAFMAVCVLWCLTDLLFLPSSIKDWQSELLYCSIKDSHTEVAHLIGPLA